MALLFIDVDGLKQINDRAGHAAGDQALIATAAALRGCFRAEDQVVRWGGDEFCVLLDETDTATEEAIVAQWHATGSRPQYPLPRSSFGQAARQPGSKMTVERLIDSADATMYSDRNRRRDTTETT